MFQAIGTAAIASGMMLLSSAAALRASEPDRPLAPFPVLELPPDVGGLIGLWPKFQKGRAAHLDLIRRQARRQGIPADLADAVAHIESSYDPNAFGSVGEVGLMQIRPQTASMLGYKGPVSGLLEPETNVRFSVDYLASAWRLTNGDLCRALMKYRAGHGEERMTALSVEYCRRARGYLAAIGSPLGQGATPTAARPVGLFGATARLSGAGRPRLASTVNVPLSESRLTQETGCQAFKRMRKLKGAAFWAAHEARIKVLAAKIKKSQLRMAAGI
jgi:soluble lytic murein transglycosylase-like protein